MSAPATVDIDAMITTMINAFRAEVETYRLYEDAMNTADDAACDEATAAASDAVDRLADLPSEATVGIPDYPLALALNQRRWLVMENRYAQRNAQAECRMIDALLAGTRFDDVPMLWHIDGHQYHQRPTDAEFQASWKAQP